MKPLKIYLSLRMVCVTNTDLQEDEHVKVADLQMRYCRWLPEVSQ